MINYNVFGARDLVFARDVVDWPTNGTEVDIGGVQFNLTALRYWNYTEYSNQTVSNESDCYLLMPKYLPALIHSNGSFVNATTCYSSIYPIGPRGFIGIGFAVFYALAIVLTLTVLAKHGALHLRTEKRFYPIGRRWQWYWALFTCACALISLLTNIEIERYFLQDLPIIICVFFWFLMCQGTVAIVWEAVRHWGSWLERQYIDPNPFVYSMDDRRAKIEFWVPMFFYFWLWMNFFMVVPRSWNFVRNQHTPEQIQDGTIPTATGVRFKVGAFVLVVAWATTLFSLRHSVRHYKPKHRGLFNRALGFMRAVPLRFVIIVPAALALIAYQALISFVFDFSLMKAANFNLPAIFAWGYGPSLIIIYVQLIYGYTNPNEDKELIRQRRLRGESVDRELGITKKPAWWSLVRGDHLKRNMAMRDRIGGNVKEVGGGRGVGRRVEDDLERHARLEAEGAAAGDDGIELERLRRNSNNPHYDRPSARTPSQRFEAPTSGFYIGKNERRHAERIMQTAAGTLFPSDAATQRARRAAELMEDGPSPPPYTDERTHRSTDRPGSAHRSNSASTTNSTNAPPQQIRSMLDL